MRAFSTRRRSEDVVVPNVAREELEERSRSLRTALEIGGPHFPETERAAAEQVQRKVAERTSITGSRTVAALAGATGSGKSSLFNFMVGEPVSRIGARRPTTSKATAAVWGDEPSAALLSWMHVDRRHQVPTGLPGGEELDGLVLLDLPDFDSRVVAHRDEADRVLQLVDVFVWVTDPQKYADAVLHDDYVRRLAAHSAVTIVVLNQADRLAEEEVRACVEDLQRLTARDGLDQTQVIATSAVTSAGLDDLHDALARVVQTHNASEQRLLGDLHDQARRLRACVGEAEAELPERAAPDLVDALAKAAGVPVVVEAVERDYKQHAIQETGWPFTRWMTRLRAAPLRRLGLERIGADAVTGISRSDARVLTGRSSLPPPTPAARAAVEVTTRRIGARAASGLPPSWADAAQAAATPDDRSMVDALDRAVTSTPLHSRKPFWWGLGNVLQWLLAVVAVLGLAWLLLLMVLGWAQLHVDAPTIGWLPVPLLMLVGALLVGLLLAAIARWLAARAARRRAAVVARQLNRAVAEVADQHIMAPVRAVLAEHRQTREALGAAAV